MKTTCGYLSRSIICCSALAISALVYGVCNYTVFGMDACTTDPCGIGCTVVSIGPTYSVCRQGGTDCCACQYYEYNCDCNFGAGNGRVCVRVRYTGGQCAGSGYCVDPETGVPFIAPMPNPPEVPVP